MQDDNVYGGALLDVLAASRFRVQPNSAPGIRQGCGTLAPITVEAGLIAKAMA